MRRKHRALLAGLTLAAGAMAGAVPPGAQAGTYHVYSCRTPSGQPAPADGWSSSVAQGGTFDQYVKNTCPEGGALIAALGVRATRPANVDLATWSFTAPQGETVSSATVWRAGDTAGGGGLNSTYEFWLSAPSNKEPFDECVFLSSPHCEGKGNRSQPLSSENRVSVPAHNLGAHLYATAACAGLAGYACPVGTGDSSGYAAAVYVYGADITLEQASGPSAANVAGELASAPAVRGTTAVTFTATDPASGVYQATVSVDGQPIQTTPLGDNGGRCSSVGPAADGRPAFLYLQPCLGSVGAEVSLDTTRLSNGVHHLFIDVIDAAGNAAPVLDRQLLVANPPPPCAPGGAGASASALGTLTVSWRGTHHARISSPFSRAQTIRGRLTGPGGAPIAGAVLELLSTAAYTGAQALEQPSPRTDPDGRFTVRVPAGGPSRTLCFAYRPTGGGPSAALTHTLSLNVRPGLGLSVSPRTARAGQTISFRGRLRGGPIPPAGKQIVLEARSRGGSWLAFEVLRVGPGGRFGSGYRFRFPGPANYQFRAISEAESDYPFARGASNVVSLHER